MRALSYLYRRGRGAGSGGLFARYPALVSLAKTHALTGRPPAAGPAFHLLALAAGSSQEAADATLQALGKEDLAAALRAPAPARSY
eukprot:tig00000459_g1059.t1